MRVAGNTHCQPHSRPAFGYFRPSACGSATQPASAMRSRWCWLRTASRNRARGFLQGNGQHPAPIPIALAGADDDLVAIEIDVLHPEPKALEEAEPAPVEQGDSEPLHPVQVLENRRHLVAGEHDGEMRRSSGPDEIVEPQQLGPEHVPIEEEQRTERLILRGRGYASFHRQTREERSHLRRGHLGGVTLVMEEDESADPEHIRLLGPRAQMPHADRNPHTVEEPRRREIRGALFRDTRERFGTERDYTRAFARSDHSARPDPSRDSPAVLAM